MPRIGGVTFARAARDIVEFVGHVSEDDYDVVHRARHLVHVFEEFILPKALAKFEKRAKK